MPSRKILWLLEQELRQLLVSRPFWFLLFFIGPLVGQGFIAAVEAYAEASGIGGGPAALAQGLSPLDGIFVPAFGAYDLAATLLFPFVAIRFISSEKESGSWKLLLQAPVNLSTVLISKCLVLLAGWLVLWIPGIAVIVFWASYGGSIYWPELLNLLAGHFLRVLLSTAVALGAAAIAKNAASAAILTLAFTVGGWALEFVAAGRGGWLELMASHTPTSALRLFEQGLCQASTVAVCLALSGSGFLLAWVWLLPLRRPWMVTAVWIVALATLLIVGSQIRPAWDLSENRRNSFPSEDVETLGRIDSPLHMTVHLAPEDPRRTDLDRNIVAKLRRSVQHFRVEYAAHSQAGMFESAGSHYGEIWYEAGARKQMSRSTTEPIVLSVIYEVTQVSAPARRDETVYTGHPLAAHANGAATFYYLAWPCLAGLAFLLVSKGRE